MKKIISIVCVLAMMLSFAVTANAATEAITVDLVEQTETTSTYAVNIDTAYTVSAISLYFDAAEAVAAGATVTATADAASKAQFNASQKMVLVTFAPTDGSVIEGPTKLATITFSNVTTAFSFTKKAESSRTKYAVAAKDPNGGADIAVQSEIAFAPNVTVAPKAEEFEAETVKGEAIEASATEVVLPKSEGSLNTNTYKNVAVFNATLGADVKYGEAGFIWVANGTETANAYKVDASVIAGGGTFEYGVVMAGIPSDVTITAIPYYVTAE